MTRAGTEGSVSIESALLAVTSMAAAAIHFAVMGDHFAESIAFGIFFAVVAWLQAVWSIGVVVAPNRWLLWTGAVGNGVVVLVWIVSRTSGLPIGPEPGTPEAAAYVDVLATILELVVIAGASILLLQGGRTELGRTRAAVVAVVAVALGLAFVTTVAIARAPHGEAAGHGQETEHAGTAHAEVTSGRPGFARVDLGDDRLMQVLIDESRGSRQVHLRFFDGSDVSPDISSLTVLVTSAAGRHVEIPVERLEAAHYAASTELGAGEWTFDVEGMDSGEAFAVTFEMNVP